MPRPPRPPRAIRAFFFDLDGTLVDSLRDIAGAMNRALAEAGWPMRPLALYRATVGEGVEALARKVVPPGVAPDDPRRAALAARYQALYNDALTRTTRPYPGVPELVAALRARDTPLAVLTNKPDGAARRVVDALFAPGAFAATRGHRPG
ncbi:MAG TPA: HAD family hydrolase, partial [Polyangiaceae bacterium]|nr:HAD family hydrolase [Polyangiaceae bacterium]